MIVSLNDRVIAALAEKGFINGLYGDVPYEVHYSWSDQDGKQCLDIRFGKRQVGSVIVTPDNVVVKVDLSGYLRGISRDEQKMMDLMKGFKVGQLGSLAASLTSPMRTTVDYNGLGRKLIVTDDIVDAATHLFDKE
jgi:hypothetical protein